MMECKRCGKTEEDTKIFSNQYCERCDRILFDRYTPYYPIVYPTYPYYEITWTCTANTTGTADTNEYKILKLNSNTTSSVVTE